MEKMAGTALKLVAMALSAGLLLAWWHRGGIARNDDPAGRPA